MDEVQASDRVLEALREWQKKEKNLISVFGERVLQQREFMREKLRLYKEASYNHRSSGSRDEKLTRAILSGEISKLEKKVYPNVIQRLFVQLLDFVSNVLRRPEIPELTLHTFNPQKKETQTSKIKSENSGQQTIKKSQEELQGQKNKVTQPHSNDLFIHQKTNDMQEQNFEYLKKQIKFTGFGEGLERELREKMSKQTPDFTLMHKAQFGNEQTEAVLHFKKSAENDMYFFNRYFLQMKNEKGDEAFTQSFRVGRENNIRLKEAYNLMNGRAIHKEHTPKEGEKYNAWFQLNFKETDEMGEFKMKQFHQNYGFDLKATLAKYPIKELESAESAGNLIKSLERGNRQSVTVVQDGKEQKMLIEAAPQFKAINIFNEQGLRVNLKAESQNPNQAQAQKQTAGEKQTENLSEKKTEGLSERKSLGQLQAESKSENQSHSNGKKLNNKEGVKANDNSGTKKTRRHSSKHSLH